MPATYAHIALVNVLSESSRLEELELPLPVIEALAVHLKFCEFGAVSPDYPYLALVLRDSSASAWAEYMHYEQTTEMIRSGVRHLARNGTARSKGLAWLLGYAAHVATDVAIHPVIKLRVGPYYANQEEHRRCEMHQDAYIWSSRMNLDEPGASEHLTSGIGQCCGPQGGDQPDTDVEALWRAMLKETYPAAYAANRPDLQGWRLGYKVIVDNIAEEGSRLFPIARHVAAKQGLVYPAPAEVDESYIMGLPVPGGGALDYDTIFDRTIEKVGTLWKMIANAVVDCDNAPLDGLPNWNLDSGCQESFVYWS